MTMTISTSELFREESTPIWTALHQHPFITELSEGTLPLDKFRFFLEQDIFYLEEYDSGRPPSTTSSTLLPWSPW